MKYFDYLDAGNFGKKEDDPGKFSIKYVTSQGIQSYHRRFFFLNNLENRGLTYCQLTAGTLLVFLVLLVKVFQTVINSALSQRLWWLQLAFEHTHPHHFHMPAWILQQQHSRAMAVEISCIIICLFSWKNTVKIENKILSLTWKKKTPLWLRPITRYTETQTFCKNS